MAYPFYLRKLLVRTGVARWLPEVRRRLDVGSRFLRHCSDRLLATPYEELEAISAILEPTAPEVVDLSQGAPRFDILPTLSAKVPADQRGWPPFAGLPELRAAVADHLFTANRLAFDPLGEILITAGALGAVQTIFDAFVNGGDRVVLFDPTAPLYPLLLRGRRARIRWLDAVVEEGRLKFRLDKLALALRGAKLMIVQTPANPTGGSIAAEDLEQIAWWADRHDVLLLNDDSFGCFRQENEAVSLAGLPRCQGRTLTMGSVSKSHALASARVGWVAGNQTLLRLCEAAAAVGQPFVSTVAQHMALAALRTDSSVVKASRAGIDARRRYAFDRLRGLEINVSWPAAGLFLWVPVWDFGLSGQEFAARLLEEQQVRVTPGNLFGPSGVGQVRLSVAAEDGRLQEGLSRLARFVNGFRAGSAEEMLRAA